MNGMVPDSREDGRRDEPGLGLSDTDQLERWMIDCLDLPEAERAAAIEELCREHPESRAGIRRRIEMLRSVGIDVLPPQPDVAAFPERLGDFRLLRRLGGGGMGVVYLAVQESLGREVALKLIRPEQLYFPGARARFQREVELVARLSHPGIVPVHLFGEEDGVPYFAMERIEGVSLGDALRELAGRPAESLGGRDLEQVVARAIGREPAAAELFAGTWVQCCLRLMLQVARALHHAHERGVLHRDVKPSNVLVTADGRALLFDFGLAHTAGVDRLTRTGSQVGSLPYMSPEQVRGAELDARSDVYALGVTLHELLTLQLPFTKPTQDELRAAILFGRAPALRARNRAVPRDVEIVAATAMERDPARRYASAAEFARDLANVLELRPIEARPPGPALRARRWIQRHPTASVAAALGLLALLVGPSVAAVMAKVSEKKLRIEKEATDEARKRADLSAVEARDEADSSRAMVDFLVGLFEESDPFGGGASRTTAIELLERGARRIPEEFAQRPPVQVALLMHVGGVLQHLGRPRDALPLLEAAQARLAATYGSASLRAALCANALASTLKALGRAAESEACYRRALAILAGLPGDNLRQIERNENQLASLLIDRGCLDEAEAELREVLATPVEQGKRDPLTAVHALGNRGQIAVVRGRPGDAESDFRSARAIALEAFGVRHPNAVMATHDLAALLKNLRKPAEALPLFEEACELFGELSPGPSSNLATATFNLAGVYFDLRRYSESVERYREALPLLVELLGPEHTLTATCRTSLGEALCMQGAYAQAETELRTAWELARRLPSQRGAGEAKAAQTLARTLEALGRTEEALPFWDRTVTVMREAGYAGSAWFGTLLREAGVAHVRAGSIGSAAALLEESRTLLLGTVGPEHDETARASGALGRCLLARGDAERARALLLESLDRLDANLGRAHPETQACVRAMLEIEGSGGDDAARERYRAMLVETPR